MKKLNILVIGTGMYVCGRGTDEYGTVIPAICQWKKNAGLGEIYIAGNSKAGVIRAKNRISDLEKQMDIKIFPKYFPETQKNNPKCYLEAIKKIPRPACAIVAVPDNLHRDIAGTAIERGLHTLVVKPLAPTMEEVLELIDLQKKSKVYCAVEFHKRLDYANLKLKDAMEAGLIGDPLYFLVEFSQRKSMPTKIFKKWIKATNVFQYLGIHYIDIIYFVTKAIPVRAMAIGQKNWLSEHGIDTYDSIEGVIEWELPSGKKFTSHILTNWIDPESTSASSDQKIKVIGTKGRFESNQKKRGIAIITDKNGIKEPNPYFCSAYGLSGHITYSGYGIDSIHQFLHDVVRIEEGLLKIDELECNRPTFRQSLVPTSVLEAVNKSLRQNSSWIDIREMKKRYGRDFDISKKA